MFAHHGRRTLRRGQSCQMMGCSRGFSPHCPLSSLAGSCSLSRYRACVLLCARSAGSRAGRVVETPDTYRPLYLAQTLKFCHFGVVGWPRQQKPGQPRSFPRRGEIRERQDLQGEGSTVYGRVRYACGFNQNYWPSSSLDLSKKLAFCSSRQRKHEKKEDERMLAWRFGVFFGGRESDPNLNAPLHCYLRPFSIDSQSLPTERLGRDALFSPVCRESLTYIGFPPLICSFVPSLPAARGESVSLTPFFSLSLCTYIQVWLLLSQ